MGGGLGGGSSAGGAGGGTAGGFATAGGNASGFNVYNNPSTLSVAPGTWGFVNVEIVRPDSNNDTLHLELLQPDGGPSPFRVALEEEDTTYDEVAMWVIPPLGFDAGSWSNNVTLDGMRADRPRTAKGRSARAGSSWGVPPSRQRGRGASPRSSRVRSDPSSGRARD